MQEKAKNRDEDLSDKEYQEKIDQEIAECQIPSPKELDDESIVFEEQTAGGGAVSSCERFLTKTFLSVQLLKRVLMFEVINIKKPTSIIRIFLIQHSVSPANIAYRVISTDSSDKELEKYAFFQVHLAARVAKNWSDAGAAGFSDNQKIEEDGDEQNTSIVVYEYEDDEGDDCEYNSEDDDIGDDDDDFTYE